MSKREFLEMVQAALFVAGEEGELPITNLRTFDEACLLTRDAGLVIELEDGSEYQLTVVQSEQPDEEDDED